MRSLRLQLFTGILAILLAAGVTVMLSSRAQMEQALIAAESRSAGNVLQMIELQVSNRYRDLLREKLRIVTERRAMLERMSSVTAAALLAHARLARHGIASEGQARALAMAYLRDLRPGGAVEAFAMSRQGHVLAHAAPDRIGRDIGALTDIKGRSLLAAVRDDIARDGHAHVVWDAPGAGERDGRRFAHFVDVPQLDLYLGVSDGIGDVERFVEAGVEATIGFLGEMLREVQVVDSGFVFLFDEDLAPITPPADWAAPLLGQRDAATGRPVMALFREAGARGDGAALRYTLQQGDTALEMEAHVSHFRPLGWYIVSTVPAVEIARPAHLLIARQVQIFALVLAVALLLAWAFAATLTGPLQRLTGYARALPERDFTAGVGAAGPLQRLARSRSEVGGLARAFRFMEDELRDKIAALIRTTREKERIESELSIARDIQNGLLPKIFPPFPDIPQIDLHAALHPARHVGGDLFDFYFLDDRRLLFTVGDVADKGVPSALFMAITKTLVKSASAQEDDPARMMARVNDDLSADNPRAMFVTLFIGLLDLHSGRVAYVNAGQNPPLLRPAAGAARFLRGLSGPPGGAMEGVRYRPLTLQLAPGDTLLVYTDGITEAMNPEQQEYGNDRLLRCCEAGRGADAAGLVNALLTDVRHHCRGAPPSDDLTLLCLTWHGAASGAATQAGAPAQTVAPVEGG